MGVGGYYLLKRCQFNITFGYSSGSMCGGVLLPLCGGFGGGVGGACMPNTRFYTFGGFKYFAAHCTNGGWVCYGGVTFGGH